MPELQSTASTRHYWSVEGTKVNSTTWSHPASYDYAETAFSNIANIPAGSIIKDVEILSKSGSERIYKFEIREHLNHGQILDFTAENIKTLLNNGSRDITLRTTARSYNNHNGEQTVYYSANASATIKVTYGQNTAHVKYDNGETSQEWVLCEVYICDDGENWQSCELRRYDGSSWVQCDFT